MSMHQRWKFSHTWERHKYHRSEAIKTWRKNANTTRRVSTIFLKGSPESPLYYPIYIYIKAIQNFLLSKTKCYNTAPQEKHSAIYCLAIYIQCHLHLIFFFSKLKALFYNKNLKVYDHTYKIYQLVALQDSQK